MATSTPRPARYAASVCLTVVSLGVGGWVASATLHRRVQAQGTQTDSHGALTMDRQLARVVELGIGKDAVVAPADASGSAREPTGSRAPSAFWSLAPKDNPGTPAQVELGKKLYFDTRLSSDSTVACATCHDVSRGFTDQRPLSEGIDGRIGRRNSPTTLNALFFHRQFWDGRAATLEDQAKLPITNPVEMGQPNGAAAVAKVKGDAEYEAMFRAAYGRAPNFDDLARALAAFERTLVFIDAPFDRFALGDADALDADARAGWALFNGKARCTACHQISSSNPIGTDNRFHNIGVSARHQDFEDLAKKALKVLSKDTSRETQDKLALETDLSELGRFVVTKNRADIGSFKTEQLRNVGITPPYMHDGSLTTLWDVIDHYNKGGETNAYLDGGIEPLALDEREIDQLVAFLFTLTDDRFGPQNRAEFARQKALAASKRPFRDNERAQRKVLVFEQRLRAGK
jgi:cytochrome c peroxidase